MTAPQEDCDAPLPGIAFPARTDHPVLAAVLADLRARTTPWDPDDPAPPPAVADYEDAP
ncbi:hypothetical protein [Streptomyces odontomachi]|uniref:hypothetical protein n=1 Tax=Streptomyces odontomachi TaxID=2944940 RepID=UPI002109C9C3|nr:hypothetical protein [Streptomyces sp. ODS25]